MNLSAIRTWSVLFAIVACTSLRADDSQPLSPSENGSLLSSLHGKPWATLSSDQGGYRLRLLTDEEKSDVEQTIHKYRELRGRGADDEQVTAAYRSMPSDVRSARFYKIRSLGPNAVELKGDDLHAILPMTSIGLVLIGPTGSLAAGGRFSRGSTAASSGASPQDFFEALQRGGGRGGFTGRRGFGGTTGGVEANEGRREDKQPEAKPTLYFLKYAAAESLVEIIHEMYADFDLLIAVDRRLNAVIIRGDAKAIEQIEHLIAALDRDTAHERQGEEPAEAPILKTYSIKEADGKTVLQVLQTLLAGQADVRLDLDTTTNKIIVLARESEHATIRATIEQLESSE